MNKDRRMEITRIQGMIDKIASLVEEALNDVKVVYDEEQDYYDNMPESIQSGDEGDAVMFAVYALETVMAHLEYFDPDTILESLDEAAG